jgi:multidrug efflux pump subunit AcrB
MVDIRVAAPGLSAADSVELAGKPLEQIVKSIDGVEHVYTQAQDNGVMVTARFNVGQDPEAAATRVDEKIKANIDKIPAGVQPPQITVRGISDVPIVVLTLTPKGAGWDERSLYTLAGKLRTEVAKVDDVGLTFITGGQREAIRMIPDPAKLAAARVPLSSVMEAIGQGGRSFPAGTLREDGRRWRDRRGAFAGAEELRRLTVRSASGAPVLLGDVARWNRARRRIRRTAGAGRRRAGMAAWRLPFPSPLPSATGPMRSMSRKAWWRGWRR